MADEPYKLHVKIGDAVFEAEGPKDTVEAQFQLFLELARNAPPPPPSPIEPPAPQTRETLTDEESRQLFDDEGELISLHVLPPTENRQRDTLLLLLWGYRVLKRQVAVTAGELIHAARQSGLKLDRIDRILNASTEYVRSGGAKKGKRYSLNNQGINHAAQLARSMLDG